MGGRLPAASVAATGALALILGPALGAGGAWGRAAPPAVSAGAARVPASQPCRLVTRAEAARILGAPVRPLVTAPQGPTCLYRAASGRRLITVAVQHTDFGKLTGRLRPKRPVRVSGAAGTAYCVTAGSPTLYVPVAGGRVLTVGGPCSVARRFALRAVPRLTS